MKFEYSTISNFLINKISVFVFVGATLSKTTYKDYIANKLGYIE